MGFRHDMRDKSTQQQQIVRQRDLNEVIRRKESEKQKETETSKNEKEDSTNE